MPRTKRKKIISLTQAKKYLETKQKLVEEIRCCVNMYKHIYIFTPHHVRTNKLKDMRLAWNESRFYLAKNKVMAKALGRTPQEEVHNNLYKLSAKLVGQCGLFFTNAGRKEVLEYFETHKHPVSPNCGDIATETVKLKAGLLAQVTHNMEPHLRKLGLPTRINGGMPELLSDYVVCTEGCQLNSNQTHILRLLGNNMALFHLEMEWHWCKEDGSFEKLKEPDWVRSQLRMRLHADNHKDVKIGQKRKLECDKEGKDEK